MAAELLALHDRVHAAVVGAVPGAAVSVEYKVRQYGPEWGCGEKRIVELTLTGYAKPGGVFALVYCAEYADESRAIAALIDKLRNGGAALRAKAASLRAEADKLEAEAGAAA